jgi:transposase
MEVQAPSSCPNCQRLQAQLDSLNAQLKTLQVAFAQLQAQLAAARKDSSTSSKPPSSDLVKPPKPPPPEGQDQRRIGGQPGHPKPERVLFPPEPLNGGSNAYVLDLCPGCGHGLQPAAAAPRVVQQIEIPEVPLSIEEHCSHPGWCPSLFYTRLPTSGELLA